MANPQIEDGYTAISNEIVEALMKINLSAYETRVLWFLFRKTYGWNKKTDRISLSQFSKCIGLDRRLIHRAVKSLSSKKMIVIYKDDTFDISYGLQKDYEKWQLSSKKMTVINRDDGVSSKEMTKLSSIQIPTKEKKTTITKTKEREVFLLPDFISKETWEAFKEMRKSVKAPLTVHASNLIVKKLITLQKENHKNKPDDVLNQSTMNSWKGVFELKDGGNGNGNKPTNANRRYGRDETIPEASLDALARAEADYERAKASAPRGPGRTSEGDDVPDFAMQ